jgi:RHS repeat-associated protein
MSVTLPNGSGLVSFRYDPFGRRIYKSSNSGASIYTYDGINLIEEANSSGAVLALYSHGFDTDEPLAMARSGTTSYYHTDGLGSVTSMSAASGALVQTYAYDSFGNERNSSGSLTTPFQYTAREFDPETNLYFHRARYYDAQVARFLSEDPIGFGGSTNLYPYVDNDPTDWRDPEGLRKAQVCRRRLLVKALSFWHHTFIQFLDDNGNITDTYGILGNPGTSNNQIPRHGNGRVEDPRPGDPTPVKDRNTTVNPKKDCKDLTLNQCQLNQLQDSLQAAVASGDCPSCGVRYRRWFPTDLVHFFDGFNSNTFTYNMIEAVETPGLKPPPEPLSPGYHHSDQYPH